MPVMHTWMRACAVGVTLVLACTGLAQVAQADESDPTAQTTTATAESTDTEDAAQSTDTGSDQATASESAPQAAESESATADAPVIGTYGADLTSAGELAALDLTIQEDGTTNNDGTWDADDSAGNDSGSSNGIVRTQDTVLYHWAYTVSSPGDVTLTQTLPDEMVWVTSESTVSCDEGTDAVSSDGHTLTCTLTDQTSGAQYYGVRAKVQSGSNGQSVTSTLSSGSLSSAASVTISATPTVSIATDADTSLGAKVIDGVVARPVYFRTALYVPIDSNRGVKGAESLEDPITFSIDISGMGTQVQTDSVCTTTLAAFSVSIDDTAGSGTWGCSLDSANQTIEVTISGAITDLRTYPEHTTRAYITGAEIVLWIPSASYTGDELSLRVQDFNPVSASGQSNYGADWATPGQEPGADLTNGVNGWAFTFSTTETFLANMSSVFVGTGTEEPFSLTAAYGADGNAKSGQTPMVSGERLRFGGYLRNDSPTLTDYTNVTVCGTWDADLLSATGDPERGLNLDDGAIVGVEWASLDLSSDTDRRAADCGTSGDGDAEWFDTIDDAGGSATVNAVRFVISTIPADATTHYFGLGLTRTDATLEVGSPLAIFWNVGSDQTALIRSTFKPETETGSSLGARALAADALVVVDASWSSSSAAPGQPRTLTVQPTSRSSSELIDVTAKDVTVEITIPAGMTVVENSWLPASTPTITENADGSSLYVFSVGDVSSTSTVDPVTLVATVSAALATPTTLTASATISSPSDFSSRSDTASLAVNALAAFQVTTTVDNAVLVPDVPVTYHTTLTNGQSVATGAGRIVNVLPFNGDAWGTTGIGTSLQLTTLSVVSGTMQVQYTTEAAASVAAAVEADPSGDTGITWADWPADGSTPEGVTAVRYLFDSLASGDSIAIDLTVTTDAIAFEGIAVNALSGVVASTTGQALTLTGSARTTLYSGTGRITGTVYHDADYSWSLGTGDSGIASVPITVTGYSYGANLTDDGGTGDDGAWQTLDLTVTTDADGAYVVEGITPGTWNLAVDDSATALAGMMAAETPSAVELGIAGDVESVDFGYVDQIDAPQAGDDSIRVAAGSTTTLDLLANDTADDSAVIAEATQPATGTVTVAADGMSVDYTAPAGSSLTETFTYTITDQARQSATATVTVTVVYPTAADSTLTVGQNGGSLDLSTLTDGVGLTGLRVEDGTYGTTSLSGSTVTYSPESGYFGTDTFVYSITDAAGTEVSGTITVVVVRGPQLTDDSAWTTAGTEVAVNVTDNDSYVGGGTVTISGAPVSGTATVTGAGQITYIPGSGFVGEDSLEYTVTDAEGQSDSATVTIQVVEVLVAVDDSAATGVDQSVDIDVLDNDQGTTLTVTATSDLTTGATAQADAAGTIRYSPPAGFDGTDTFTYTITDSVGQTATASVTVTVMAGPAATGLDLRTGQAVTVTGDAGTLVSSAGTVTAAVTTQPDHGTLSVVNQTVEYTPEADFVGTDSAVLTWTDEVGQSVTQTVTIEVVAAPTVLNHTASILNGATVSFDLLDGATGDQLSVTATGTPAGGTLVFDQSSGLWVYTATAGFDGVDEFTYTVADSVGQTATGTITVTVAALPAAPTVLARTGVLMAVTIDPVASGATGTLSELTLAVDGEATQGTAVLNTDGTVSFTPAEGFIGTTGFGYTMTDDLGQSASGRVEVDVLALTADTVTVETTMNTAVIVDVLSAVQGSSPVVESVGSAAHGTAELADGQVVYTPATDFTGADTFAAEVTDEFGQAVTVTVSVLVSADVTATPVPSASATPPVQNLGGSRLAVTGGEVVGLGLLALALLIGGWVLIVAYRRRGAQD